MTLDLYTILFFIHFLTAILWWSLSFLVVFIISPINKNGILSVVFPVIQKYVVILSTITISSGLLITLINLEYNILNFFIVGWNYLLVISGIASIPVYLTILLKNRTRTIQLKTNLKIHIKKKKPILPYILFMLLTFTLLTMIFISESYF